MDTIDPPIAAPAPLSLYPLVASGLPILPILSTFPDSSLQPIEYAGWHGNMLQLLGSLSGVMGELQSLKISEEAV